MNAVLSPFPPDLAVELSASSLGLLLSRFAPPPRTPGGIDPADPVSLARALSYRLLHAELADALALVARLATPLGREALLEALVHVGAPERDRLHLSPVDLAVRVLCARGTTTRQARAAVKRALVRVGRHFAPRAWYTLLWARRELPARADALSDAARAVHGGDLVDCWTASVEGDVLRFVAVYRGPGVRVVTAENGRRRARTARPLACDVVRWDARDGRVAFCLARPSQLREWAAAIERALAGDGSTFLDAPAFTHKSLHDKGASWLASVPLPPGVKSLDVVAAEVFDGKRTRVRGEGSLAQMHALVGRARGYLSSVTLRAEIEGHDEAVDATIDLPWKVLCSDARFEERVRLVMGACEILAPGTLPDDLPSLAPTQPDWRWTDVLGAAGFARALKDRTLSRVRGKRPSGREHRRWGSLLRAFKVPGEDAEYVVGEEMAIPAFDAKPDALVVYAIDWERVAEVLREAMSLAPAKVDAPAGALAIGELEAGPVRIVVFTLVRAVGEGEAMPLLKQLRQACGRATPALVVPRGRSLGGAVAEVEVTPGEQLGVDEVAWVAGKLAEECGAGDDVAPSRFATKDAPLVLSVARGEAWYGRVQLLLTDNQLAMLFALAKAKGWMKATELGLKITPDAALPDQTVRKARLSLEDRLKASFDAAGVAMPEGLAERIVEFERSKGYRIGVGVTVR